MPKRIERYRRYIEATHAVEIARRLFVMNAFDGVLTLMGVVIGAHLSGVTDPHVVITAGIAASLAMGISGISGAYLAERAERRRDLKKLETAMLKNLEDTQYARATEFASVVVAVVDGISPALSAAIIVVPYLFAGKIGIQSAFYASLLLGLAVLFTLGIFLARVSDERPLASGIQMILVGIATIIIVGLVAQ
ncbi:MAG TPA: VIT1/CCC1 transporter family protein [Methanothrix sp.]|jgi:predicted membrane protein (TIGR00267 family)|nr:VIT1/CCC1 transporter family protein [Methanothrix sp.]HOV82729.1 VIT1/CCC1 transporter family protein [Methanothrix sp.]HPC88716.1 VIT1/CCC1 transporter family protein [Methanothrix sp.]HQE87917.1 VIT1/CCC1 transporter family protein [Methanothrix sp.]HQI68063.1 VIT1/CCC1 transporter family protein [Methanothrix sp.]